MDFVGDYTGLIANPIYFFIISLFLRPLTIIAYIKQKYL